ncbi:MAG: undecaprenyl-phosphate glucose phosphotransferase [Pseudomonadota bacterium]
MTEGQVRRHALAYAGLVALKALLPALIAVTSLRALAAFYGERWGEPFAMLAATAAVLCLAIPRPRESESRLRTALSPLAVGIVVRWLAVVATLLALAYLTKYSTYFARRVVLTWAFVTPWIIIAATVVVDELIRRILNHPANARAAVFAGWTAASRALADRILSARNPGLRIAGFFDDRDPVRLGPQAPTPHLGNLEDLVEFVKRRRIDVIFVALPVPHVRRVVAMVYRLRDTTASIYYIPDLYVFDLLHARSGEVHGVPVIAMCESPMRGERAVVKRLTDVALTTVVLSMVLPVMLLIALAIRLTSRGPIVFRQRRYGLDGEEIVVYKFRTMTVTENGPQVVQARPNDPRVTPVGRVLRRYSLDELPLLINVLPGRMSLVGPRPHAVAHNEEYRRLIAGYMRRHKVLPGITGLAQVNGCRGATERVEDMQARVDYDLDYLRRWTPMLDLQILWKTVAAVLRQQNAY